MPLTPLTELAVYRTLAVVAALILKGRTAGLASKAGTVSLNRTSSLGEALAAADVT